MFEKSIATRKWFVPFILLLLAGITLLSFSDSRSKEHTLSDEKRIEELCNSIQGVSEAQVMITYRAVPAANMFTNAHTDNEILGIAVLCKGGDIPEAQLMIHQLLETLFQLPSTRITVSAKK